MRKLIFVAAALAAGASSFAASAANSDRVRANVVAVKPAPVENKKEKSGLSALFGKTEKEQPAAKQRASKKAAAATRTGKSRKPVVLKAKAAKVWFKKNNKTQIDMTTTASIARAVAPNRAGIAYGDIVSRYAASYGVPASLAHAVIRVESNYRVDARGSAGEVGLMQIKPATARMMGYTGSVKGLFNPETNIKYGMKYLGMAHKLGGGATCGTILRYNAGHAAKRMNPVSSAYCSKVKRHLAGA